MLLPTPGSPASMTAPRRPARALVSASRSRASCGSRPAGAGGGSAPAPAAAGAALGQEPRIVLEDAPLEPPRRLARLQPELAQPRGELAVGRERVDLAAGAVEREHELADQLLAQRLAPDQPLQLGHRLRGAAQGHERAGAALLGLAVELLEPPDLGLRELRAGQLGVGRPAPQRERGVVGGERRRRREPGRGADLALEAERVDLVGVHGQPVALAVADEERRRGAALAPRLQERAQVGDPHGERARGGVAREVVPGRVEQRVGRHGAPGVDQQPGEDRALLGARRGAAEVGADDLDRAENAQNGDRFRVRQRGAAVNRP